MAVSIEQLQAFVETNEQGSFSSAARKLHKAQSVISTLVANLEIDLGVELFDRSSRSPKLTEAGAALIGRAQSIIEQRQRLIVAAEQISIGVESKLVLAIEHQVQIANLGELMKLINAEYPHVDINIRHDCAQNIWSDLSNEKAQLGVLIQPEHALPDLDFTAIGKQQLICVVGAEHSLANQQKVSWEALKQNRQIFLNSFDDPTKSQWYGAHQLWQVSDVAAAVELVIAQIGWSILPAHAVSKLVKDKKLVELNLAFEKDKFSQQVDLVWLRTRALRPAARFLAEKLSELAVIKN